MHKTDKSIRSDTREVVLSGHLTLAFAGAIRDQVLQALAGADAVQIVMHDVDEIDLSLVQIICAAHRSAIRQGKSLVLHERLPGPFVRIIDEAGLQGHIGCSSAERGGCLWRSQADSDTKYK